MEMLICPECGASNPLEASACESCGSDLSTIKSVMDSANSHYNEALALAHSGKLDEAISQLEAALSMSAQNPNYYNLLGTLYAQKGLFSESIDAWEECLALDPEMDKAYQNIEKARQMEEEYAEEQRQRPFLIAAISCGAAAVIFLVTTIIFGVNAYFKAYDIIDLEDQLTSLSGQLRDTTAQYNALNKMMPGDGIPGLLKELDQLRGQLTEKESQIENLTMQQQRINDRREDQITRLTTTTQELRTEIQAKDQELQKINQYETAIRSNNSRIESLENELAAKSDKLLEEQQRVKNLRENLVIAQETTDSIREERDRAVTTAKKAQENAMESVHQQILDLRSEIAAKEREYNDLKYTSEMVTEALKNLEASQFEIAFQNVQNALGRSKDNAAALYLQSEIQRILNDPVEQEIRKQEAIQRQQEREKKRLELIALNLERANKAQKEMEYQAAIDWAQSVIKLSDNPKDVEKANQVINAAEEVKKQITLQLLEARRFMDEQNPSQARSLLQGVLKRDPKNREAQELLDRLGQSS